jgi:gamma-polyglutamate biosynthesis protein CapA
MRKIFLMSFILVLFFLSGCIYVYSEYYREPKVQLSQKVLKIKQEIKQEIYQYTKPWDKELYDSFFVRGKQIQPKEPLQIKGGIIPHHLLSGHTLASFFLNLKEQKPEHIVILSPNHFNNGYDNIITTKRNWKTPYGIVKTDIKNVDKIQYYLDIFADEETIEKEHGIHGIIPFIAKTIPKTKVLTFAIKEKISKEELDEFIDVLKKTMPKDTVFLSSIDFSHYQIPSVSKFHDEISQNVIQTFDFERINMLEIDSHASLYALLKLMEGFGTQKLIYEHHTDSAELTLDYSTRESTSHYVAYFGKGQKSTKKAISILQFGDMMLDRGVSKRMKEHGGLSYILDTLAGAENRFFQGVDIVTANLEGPFMQNRIETTKEIAFRFDPALIPELQTYNFNLFTLANNHSLDMRSSGLAESKQHLEKAGIPYYGNQFYVDEHSYLQKEIGGINIGFIGLNDTHYTMDEAKVKELIETSQEQDDKTIINIHWGQEYKTKSNQRQQKLAHDFIDAGADVVIGHHPHVVQECEIYKNRPICYSLGNFIFDQYFSEETQFTIGLGLNIYEDKVSIYILPIKGKQSQLDFLPYKQSQNYLRNFFERSGIEDYELERGHFDVLF